ncbi:hypothetical protein, partial [Staphylococcus shinii]|uniref:hypothetical protein n=1 Tax=Staphylococcus shinii TaxID=2912228 RepID=UPI003B9705CC
IFTLKYLKNKSLSYSLLNTTKLNQRANYNQNNIEKDNFYFISIEIAFFHLYKNFMSQILNHYIRLVGLTLEL